MADGLQITRAQGSNRVWHAVQETHATLFAMRVLSDVKQRKDVGRPQVVKERNGKDTVTAVNRARHDALKEASPISDRCQRVRAQHLRSYLHEAGRASGAADAGADAGF